MQKRHRIEQQIPQIDTQLTLTFPTDFLSIFERQQKRKISQVGECRKDVSEKIILKKARADDAVVPTLFGMNIWKWNGTDKWYTLIPNTQKSF